LQWRHAAYYLAFAETAAPEVLGPQQVAWLDRLEVDHNNLRAALAWSRAEREQWEVGVRLAIALGDFWGRRGYMSEGRRWLEGALAQMEGRAAEPRACALRAEALYGAATLAMLQYDTTTPPPLLEESLALFRALGNTWGVASALRNLGCTAAILEGDHGRGIALLEESLALFHTLGDRWGMAWTLSFLGWAFHAQGNYARAARILEESLAHFREAGDLHGIGAALGNLGTLTAKQGDFTQAAVCLRESLGLHRAMGSKVGIGIALEAVAGLEALQAHEPEAMARAARLCAAAEALHASLGSEAFAGVRGDRERMVATLRTCLDEEAFAVAWAEGRAMTPEQAIAYALEDAPHAEQAIARHPPFLQTAPTAESRQYPAGLTEREVEILRLVTQGLTYAQIAERLIISSHTVNAHLRTIYGKLGVNSRSSATRFAVEHRLV
jgi:DNA-binding CsgD family transcriptional regulator